MQRLLLVTGKLAEPAVREVLRRIERGRFDLQIAVLPITVAALMQTRWLARKLELPEDIDRVLLPGKCETDPIALQNQFGVPFEKGPVDIFDLPEYLDGTLREPPDLSRYDIEILAEINHAPRLPLADLVQLADQLRNDGADVIDLGCVLGESWNEIGNAVRALRENGHRVSVDSFDRREVEAAIDAGAELVLSCNSTNVAWAKDLAAEWVVIPDDPNDLATCEPVIAELRAANRSWRVDAILEPIGFGFARSLVRFHEARLRWPDAEMMMGVGNLTELSEVDSAGVNFLLAAFCQEFGIRSVLTTQVINWAKSSVAELDVARRLVRLAVEKNVLPKHVASDLVMLRDPKVNRLGDEALARLAEQITDPNFRVFAERGELHLINRDGHWRGGDAFELFDLMTAERGELDSEHAFYLGYELAKAQIAMLLGKQYRQDEALRWGLLTQEEKSAIERRRRREQQ